MENGNKPLTAEELYYKCDLCNGDGFTSEHANHPHPDGDCQGECPIAVQCEKCEATGFIKFANQPKPVVSEEELFKKEQELQKLFIEAFNVYKPLVAAVICVKAAKDYFKGISLQPKQTVVSEEEIEKMAEKWYSSQGKSVNTDYNTMPSYIEGIKLGLSIQSEGKGNDSVEFAEWISDNGWIKDPFPRKEFNDDKIRYTDIVHNFSDELTILTIQELYELFTKSKKQK